MASFRETGYRVARLSRRAIRDAAHRTRDYAEQQYGLYDDALDVVRLIEKWGLERAKGQLEFPDYRVADDTELPNREAEYLPRDRSERGDEPENEHIFLFRNSAWVAAAAGKASALETFAHEIGHCVLQHPKVSYTRMYRERIRRDEDSEWQADVFMDELLMDSRRISEQAGWGEIQERFKVTRQLAIRRVRELMQERMGRPI